VHLHRLRHVAFAQLESSDPKKRLTVSSPSDSLQPLDVSLSPQERFEEYLQTRKLRQTSQRKFLIDAVFQEHDHFDADELIDRLPRRGEKNYVSSATVYRTLREFVDAGLLNSFQLDGRTVYELDYGYPQHDHLYCARCRKLFEFQSELLTKIRDEVAAEKGFRVSGHRMIVHGVCRQCSKNRRKKRKQDLV
jgi:Fur family ferric uptake transcriptional regulator